MSAERELRIWEGIYPAFKEADDDATGPGFEGEIYRTRALDAAQVCLAALDSGKPIPPFHKQRSTMLPPVAAMMLGNRERLSVLDFGGGLGIGYMTLVESLPGVAQRIEYSIVEVPCICASGRELFGTRFGALGFMEEVPKNRGYDLIHSASALQYIENWRHVIEGLTAFGAPYLLLSDVFAGPNPTFVTLQNYYGSRIKHWFLNFDQMMSVMAEIGYRLEMKCYVTSRRLGVDDVLPMGNFPPSHRLEQTLHLLFRCIQ